MLRKIKYIALFFAYFFLCDILYPQTLFFQRYTNDDILPTITVYSLFQDSKGFLWIGTDGGVTKFDGLSKIDYTIQDGLPDNLIRVIFEDSKGNIWFGSDKGPCVFDGKTFNNFNSDSKLTQNLVYDICEDSSGVIWLACNDSGLGRYDNDKFEYFNINFGLSAYSARSLLYDSKGILWIGTLGQGLIKYNFSDFTIYNVKNGLVDNNILSLQEDRWGNIWIGTLEGVSKFDGNLFTNYLSSPDFAAENILSIEKDNKGNLWFSSYVGGLSLLNREKFTKYTTKNGLPKNTILCSLIDKRGDLWLGLYNGGLCRLPVEKFLNYTVNDGLADNSVNSFAQDYKGDFWFAHYGYGVTKYSNGKYYNITTKDGLVNNYVAVIYSDSKGRLWFGTKGGLSVLENGGFRNFSQKDGLADDLILSIKEDKNGNIWFGTGSGITKFSNEKFVSYKSQNNFPEDWVNTICEDNLGNLWFGTWDNGVVIYNGNEFTRLNQDDGLPPYQVYCIIQDQYYDYWICTEGGLSKYDGDKIITFTTKNGLPSDLCYSIIEYKNYMFIGTGKGIARFEFLDYQDKGTDAFRNYTTKDGLINSETNQGAYYRDKKGVLWFGGPFGAISFDPEQLPNLSPTPVYIKNVTVISPEREIIFNPDQDFVLDYNWNNIRIEYAGISFSAPQKNTYKMKLQGIDENWIETTEHTVFYRALPSGNYIFRVLCKNSDGIWSKNEATITFYLPPPFWQTWWFLTLLTITAMSLIYALYVYKTRQVKRRNIVLANMVSERTQELQKEKNKSDELLHNILPSSLVEELKSDGYVRPRAFKNVSILFTDFKGFTYTSSVLPPDKLVKELNELFKGFDEIIERFGLEKLKTIGDSYMAAGGLPEEKDDHAVRLVYAAWKMLKFIQERNKIEAIKWDMRAGIHSGNVIAGVVGTKKFTYDIWGDTVNIASRMESSGEASHINISAYTYMLVKDYFDCEYRGKIDAKGKGKIDMYFVKEPKSDIEQFLTKEQSKVV